MHEKMGLDIGELVKDIDIDFRRVCNCWLSRALGECDFKRLLVIEFPYKQNRSAEIIEQAFLAIPIIAAKGIPVSRICMPMLSAGIQKQHPEDIVRPILESSLFLLENIEKLHEVFFVESNKERCGVLSDAMDTTLGRKKTLINNTDNIVSLLRNIKFNIRKLNLAEEMTGFTDHYLDSEKLRPQDIGIMCRKISESYVFRYPDTFSDRDLSKKIQESLVPVWVKSHLHTMRIFGNLNAHAIFNPRPKTLYDCTTQDYEILLSATARILQLWCDEKQIT